MTLTVKGQKDYNGSLLWNAKFDSYSSAPGSRSAGHFWTRSDQSDEAYIYKNGSARIIITAEKGVDSLSAATGDYSMGTHKITNVVDPASAQDAATKNYVDVGLAGATVKAIKEPVRVANSVGNITVASPGATIDGVTLVSGDRVLLTAQTTPSQNGVYVWNGAAVPMTRALDAAASGQYTNGMLVPVSLDGHNDFGAIYQVVFVSPFTLGTTSQSWFPINYAGYITDGFPARVVATANITVASPGTTIDGYTLTAPDRVLLTNQTTPAENGLYQFNGSATPMTRYVFESTGKWIFGGRTYPIWSGTANAGSKWMVTSVQALLGTNAVTFSKIADDVTVRSTADRDRTNHTGTQLAVTISDFTTAVQAIQWRTMAVPTSSVDFNSQFQFNVGGVALAAGFSYTSSFSTVGTASFQTRVNSDANVRWQVDNTGFQTWGNGTAVVDVGLKREAAGVLAVRNAADSAYAIMRGADAVGNNDFATLQQITALSNNQDPKASVLVATTGAESFTIAAGSVTAVTGLTSGQIDGYALANGERFLIKNAPAATGAGTGGAPGSTQPGNGFYTVVSGSGTASLTVARSTDADGNSEVTPGASTWVERGSANAQSEYTLAVTGPITVGTTAIAFVKTGSAIVGDPTLVALAGLTGTVDTLPYFSGTDIASLTNLTSVARTLLAQTTQALMRTTGLGSGATGDSLFTATTAAAARATLGACGQYMSLFGDGSNSTWTFNPGTTGTGSVAATGFTGYPTWVLLDASSGDEITDVPVNCSGTFVITVGPFLTVPTTNQYRLVATGPK